jgi:hypothetical protein
MAALSRHVICLGVSLSLLLSLVGCAGLGFGKSAKAPAGPDLGPTIGSVADIFRSEPTTVEGYGLVAGLSGTGSAICPPVVRSYLKQFILAQIPNGATNLDELINSPDTAVVHLEGVIPPMAMKGDRFDVRVSPVVGSDTTSLRGGRLYLAELKPPGTFGFDARVMGMVEGPVFVDVLGAGEPTLKTGYVLGGGKAASDYSGRLRLRQADFRMVSTVRNRLNERYGPEAANALSAADVGFDIPAEYRLRKERFIKVLGATYLTASADLTAARIDSALKGLTEGPDKETSEMTLEALGRDTTAGLVPLLKSPNEETRLRAARCMLYLHDDRALETLDAMANDSKSSRRVEAIEAIAMGARQNDAGVILRRLLGDDDEQVVRAAFEHLRRLKDPTVREELVNRDFYLDLVPNAKTRAILVFRSGAPRIVLLGPSMNCRDDVSVESSGETVIARGTAGTNGIMVARKPTSSGTRPPSARSSTAVSDIIRALGADPTAGPQKQPAGLGVPYAEIASLLERMCEAKAIDARFWPGPPAKFDLTVKK